MFLLINFHQLDWNFHEVSLVEDSPLSDFKNFKLIFTTEYVFFKLL